MALATTATPGKSGPRKSGSGAKRRRECDPGTFAGFDGVRLWEGSLSVTLFCMVHSLQLHSCISQASAGP